MQPGLAVEVLAGEAVVEFDPPAVAVRVFFRGVVSVRVVVLPSPDDPSAPVRQGARAAKVVGVDVQHFAPFQNHRNRDFFQVGNFPHRAAVRAVFADQPPVFVVVVVETFSSRDLLADPSAPGVDPVACALASRQGGQQAAAAVVFQSPASVVQQVAGSVVPPDDGLAAACLPDDAVAVRVDAALFGADRPFRFPLAQRAVAVDVVAVALAVAGAAAVGEPVVSVVAVVALAAGVAFVDDSEQAVGGVPFESLGLAVDFDPDDPAAFVALAFDPLSVAEGVPARAAEGVVCDGAGEGLSCAAGGGGCAGRAGGRAASRLRAGARLGG